MSRFLHRFAMWYLTSSDHARRRRAMLRVEVALASSIRRAGIADQTPMPETLRRRGGGEENGDGLFAI